jgi:hypothetical protein
VVPVRLAGQAEWTLLSVPVAVAALAPVPVLAPASVTVSPGATVTYDLRTLTTWQGRSDWDRIAYRVSHRGDGFTVQQKGATLTVTGADDARPGAEEVAVVEVTSHPGVAPARIILRVGAVPSTMPQAGTVSQRCSQASGSSCTVGVIGGAGEVNPLPRTPLTVVAVRAAGECTGVTFTVTDAAHVRASWTKDTPGQTCTASFSVRDAQGRETAGDRDGRILFDLQGYPKAPAALIQSGYASGQVTLRVDAGPSRLAYPTLTGFLIRSQGNVVATCAADGTCPVIAAPNGEQRRYTATAVNAVGESDPVATTAWAYDAPATPSKVTAAPIATSGDGGMVSVAVEGIDPSQTAGVRLTSDAGDTVDVPVADGATSVFVPSYRIGVNTASRLTVTPYSRFSLPPGFDGSTTGQSRSIFANGVGAPKSPALAVASQTVNGDGTATITMRGSALRNGDGSTVRLAIVEDGQFCRPADIGDETVIQATFTARIGQAPRYRLCAASWYGGDSFGRVETTQQVVVKPTAGSPTPQGYTFTVAASPDVSGNRAEWTIKTKPSSSTDTAPGWADVQMSGWPSSVFDADPGIRVWYQWGPYQGDPVAVVPAAGSAPTQVQAQWGVAVCNGGDPLGYTTRSSAGAAFAFDAAAAVYRDADGTTLPTPTDGTVPVGAVSVSGIGVTVSWGKWGLNDATASFGASCTPNDPSTPSPTAPPADSGK